MSSAKCCSFRLGLNVLNAFSQPLVPGESLCCPVNPFLQFFVAQWIYFHNSFRLGKPISLVCSCGHPVSQCCYGCFNTLRLRQDGCHGRHFQMHFLEWKLKTHELMSVIHESYAEMLDQCQIDNDLSVFTEFRIQMLMRHQTLTLILAWISNYIHYNMWDEITDPISKLPWCSRWSLGMVK